MEKKQAPKRNVAKQQRAEKVNEAIRLVWGSLDSHLYYTNHTPKDGTNKFHQECVKEYARLITLLSELY
ncbi:hypothetical protein EKK58_06100 [Candidatus Dependentiae bacterium]|nr:MAG: hypothetical protein EKK58_06100 [Candidatus Dependentiae bacterium]